MEAVNQASESLLRSLTDELDLVCVMQKLAGDKEACLVSGDVNRLNHLLEQEEELVSALNNQEDKRKAGADSLASALGISGQNLTLKAMISLIADPGIQRKLSVARQRLNDAIEQLGVINARLKELLKVKLDYTDMMINLIFTPKKKNNTYNNFGGRTDETDSLYLLDYHA